MKGATSYEWQFGNIHIMYCHLTGGSNVYKSIFNIRRRLHIQNVGVTPFKTIYKYKFKIPVFMFYDKKGNLKK